MGDNANDTNKPILNLKTIIKLKAKANHLNSKRQKKEEKKLKKELYDRIDFVHHKAIPVEYLREFTPIYRFTIGTFLILAYISVFVYFTNFFYTENITTEFVAIEDGDSKCKEVTKSFSSVSLAGANGKWEGAIGFDYSNAPVLVTFRNIEATEKEFTQLFEKQKERLNEVNEQFKNNNLGSNILFWTNYKNSVRTKNTEQTFQFVGDPAMIFDGQIFLSTVAAADYTGGEVLCYGPSTTFESTSAMFRSSFDYADDYATCGAYVFTPYDIAFALKGLVPSVEIKLDSRSFTTAMSLNRGGLNYSNSYDVQVMKELTAITRGTIYTYLKLEDIRYPGMKAIYCVKGSWCMVQVGRLLFLPVFGHSGDSITADAKPGKNGNSPYCSTFDFFLGLVEMGALTAESHNFLNVLQSFQDYFGTFNKFNEQLSPIIRGLVSGDTKIDDLKAFANVTFLPLRIIAFRSINQFETIISNYGYELKNGSCNAALTDALSKWSRLAEVPPESLVERYITCIRSQWFSFLDAFGLGMANTDLCLRIFAYALLPFLLWFSKSLFGMRFIDPAERTMENFEEVLHKSRQKTIDDSAATSDGESISFKSRFTKAERDEAARIVRLLSIALQEEEEEDEEEDRREHRVTKNANVHHRDAFVSHNNDEEASTSNAVEMFSKITKRPYALVHPVNNEQLI